MNLSRRLLATVTAWLLIAAIGAAVGWAGGTWLADEQSAQVSAEPAPNGPTTDTGLTVQIDDTGDVVCYTNHDAGRMDCVPTNQTAYAG